MGVVGGFVLARRSCLDSTPTHDPLSTFTFFIYSASLFIDKREMNRKKNKQKAAEESKQTEVGLVSFRELSISSMFLLKFLRLLLFPEPKSVFPKPAGKKTELDKA
jgi:hypothetical protein